MSRKKKGEGRYITTSVKFDLQDEHDAARWAFLEENMATKANLIKRALDLLMTEQNSVSLEKVLEKKDTESVEIETKKMAEVEIDKKQNKGLRKRLTKGFQAFSDEDF